MFKRGKDVEFTIFLPHEAKDYHDPIVAAGVLDQLLQSVVLVLQQLGLNSQTVLGDIPELRTEFLNTPGFLERR